LLRAVKHQGESLESPNPINKFRYGCRDEASHFLALSPYRVDWH
jgi:hypothetical protein